MNATDVYFYFIKKIKGEERVSKTEISKGITQAKRLLINYDANDIIRTIDYLIDVKKANVYAFGYISAAIDDTLKVLREIDEKERLKELVAEQTKLLNLAVEEIQDDSTNRNKEKVIGGSNKCRVGKKFDFDLITQ